MSKYIIEIPDDAPFVLFRREAYGKFITKVVPVAELEELNPDYINEHYGELQDEAYQAGMSDAWEAAKKIFGHEIDGGLDIDELKKAFGDDVYCTADIIRTHTAEQAIAKLKAYEDKQKEKDRIEVGDEVEWEGEKFTILRVFTPKGCYEQCDGFDDAGNGYTNILTKDVKKTGKHYDIQSILEAMRTHD